MMDLHGLGKCHLVQVASPAELIERDRSDLVLQDVLRVLHNVLRVMSPYLVTAARDLDAPGCAFLSACRPFLVVTLCFGYVFKLLDFHRSIGAIYFCVTPCLAILT
jgi:hypothetical protein